MGFEELRERVVDWRLQEVVVDIEERIVRNVALAGTESRNGYRYSEEALQSAVELYRDKPVFLDHAEHPQKPRDRSTRDLVGTIIDCRFEADRIRGDIQVLDTESGRTFLALAEQETPGVGMSHVVMARRNSDGSVVETIDDVVSVDAVVFPATTTTLQESVENSKEGNGLSDQKLLRSERDWWRKKAEQSQRELLCFQENTRQEESVRELLLNSGFPEFAVTEIFESTLVGLESDQMRRDLIEDRLSVIQKAMEVVPGSRERFEERDVDDERILSVIRSGGSFGPRGVVR